MTIKDFDKQEWKADMKAKYHGGEFDIVSVNFEERLVGLEDHEEINWIRCENIEIK